MANKTSAPLMNMSFIIMGLVALVGIAGFGGWLTTGDDLFMSLIQTGMRWCS